MSLQIAMRAVQATPVQLTPRVLFVIPGEDSGSNMIFARRQADMLRSQGVDVRTFFLQSRTSPVRIVREWRRFRAECATFSPQVVHAHYGTVTALFAALGAGRTPLVITYRGSDLNPCPGHAGIRTSLSHWLSQLAALRAARIVCVSAELRGRLWWRRSRVAILATGVDIETFKPESRETARRRLGWEMTAPAVLFHCGHDPQIKRLDLAEAAIAVARRTQPGLLWKVLDGSTAPELVPSLMNAADCLLITSQFEGSPTVAQEALASNLPIVSVDVGDVADRIRGVANSRIVARDPEALGCAVAEMIAPPRRSGGRRKARECSSAELAQRLRGMYLEILQAEPEAN